jgi:hypothetical protein
MSVASNKKSCLGLIKTKAALRRKDATTLSNIITRVLA